MFKFLLKNKTGLGNKHVFITLSIFWSAIFCLFFFKFADDKYSSLTSFLVPVLLMIGIGFCEFTKKIVINYRLNTPYNIYTIEEDNKELEVREYPVLHMKEYYYNGKLHRESGLAVEFDPAGFACEKHGDNIMRFDNGQKGFLFLNGKKYNYREFHEVLPKVRIQNKTASF